MRIPIACACFFLPALSERRECSNETIESYLKELPSNLENLRANQREIDKQLKALTEKKEQHEIKEAFQVIKLVLESPEDCNANCEIEYFEKSVQWKSTYEIHAVADSAAINVVSRARITQTTGEDWENVRVFLFTGNPTVQQKIPALKKMGIINLYASITVPDDQDDEYLDHNSENFHKHLGFKTIGYFRSSIHKFNRWYGMIFMEKIIGEYK